MTDIQGHRNDLFHVIEGGEVKHRCRYEAGDPVLGDLDHGEAFALYTQHIAAHEHGPGMYGSDGTFIPYISEEEFTAMNDIELTPDPQRFSWLSGGVLVSNTLAAYAKEYEDRYYGGDGEGLSDHVIHWPSQDADAVKLPVSVTKMHTDENDYIHYHLSVPGGRNMIGGQVHFTIDGRA